MDPKSPDAGTVIIWKDASEKWARFTHGITVNIIFAFVALIIIEIVLILGWNYAQKRLNDIISSQTRELEKLAAYDGLTGILNRRSIEEIIKKEFDRAERYQKNFSLIIADLDKFKAVNDTYGHNTGDKVLIQAAALIMQTRRNIDYCGRWGGEEFVIATPETDLENCGHLAQRLCSAMNSAYFPDVGSVTISCGVAQFRSGDTLESLLERADKALFRAKKNGRNRVETDL